MITQSNGGRERTRWGFLHFGRREETGPLVDVAYESALAAYRVWHSLEGRKRDIIDFDLTEGPSKSDRFREQWTDSVPTIEERRRIIAGLEMVDNEIASVSPPADKIEQHKYEFAKAQVRASLTFARLQAGQVFSYDNLLENTLGVHPSEIPTEVIDNQSRVVMNKWEDLFIATPSEEDMKVWRKENQLTQEETISEFKASSDRFLSELVRFLGDDVVPNVNVSGENVPEYYWAWSDAKNGQFSIRLNFSQVRGKTWTLGKVEELVPHEAQAHMGRMARREKLIKSGKLHPFFGITTVHGPEAVIEEGLGVTMVKFIPGAYKALSPEGKFQVEATILRHMVLGNLQVRLNGNNPPSTEEAVAYVKQYLPWESPAEIERQIRERSEDPKYKIYLYAYAIGTWIHLIYARTLNCEGRKVFLQKLMSLPFTPKQEAELWQSLVQQDRFRHKNAKNELMDLMDPAFLPKRKTV